MKQKNITTITGVFLVGLIAGLGSWVIAADDPEDIESEVLEEVSNKERLLLEQKEFDYKDDPLFNPEGKELISDPVIGKESGNTFTAGEFNRIIETVNSGSSLRGVECPEGEVLTGFDSEGDPYCSSIQVLTETETPTTTGDPTLPTLLYELNNNTQTSTYACAHDVDLEEYCGDEDGCTIRVLMNHKTQSNDQVHIIDEHIYMEEPGVFSSDNNSTQVFGSTRQSGGGDRDWINGTGTRRDTMFNPWDWVWMYNYKHANCNGSHEPYPADEPYKFSFMTHPNVRSKVYIYDSLSDSPVQKWNPSCEDQGGVTLPDDSCDFSGTVTITGLDTDSSSEKCYVNISCPNGRTVTGIRFGKDDWTLSRCHNSVRSNFTRYCAITRDEDDFDINWTTDTQGRAQWAGTFELR